MSKDEAMKEWRMAGIDLAFAHGAVGSNEMTREDWLDDLASRYVLARKKASEYFDV